MRSLKVYAQCVKEHIDQDTGEPNGSYPSLSFKVKKKEGNILCKFYDDNRELVNVNDKDAENHMLTDILKKKESVINI